MAYEEVTTFEPPPDTHTHLLIDAWYMARRIWQAARRRGWDVTGGLKSNRGMRVIEPDGTRWWVRVDEYAASLRADDFEPVLWPTQEGDKIVYAHLVQTWVRKLEPCQVLSGSLPRTLTWSTPAIGPPAAWMTPWSKLSAMLLSFGPSKSCLPTSRS